jgi:ubiquinone biosynthesis protein COQ9
MLKNLNEECLLHFLKSADESFYTKRAALASLLSFHGIEIKFQNFNYVHDIIDDYEHI